MVDFKTDGTMTTPSWEIIKLLALEKRENLMLAIEFYFKHKYEEHESEQDINIVRARLWVLYYELEAWLKRTFQEEALLLYRARIDSNKVDEVFEVVSWLNKFMDDKKLTRIDNIKSIDRTRVELENESDDY
jgi:hypothetical protein